MFNKCIYMYMNAMLTPHIKKYIYIYGIPLLCKHTKSRQVFEMKGFLDKLIVIDAIRRRDTDPEKKYIKDVTKTYEKGGLA